MGKIAAYLLKNAADGSYGELVKKAYWFMAGKKTKTSMAFGAVWGALWYLNTHGGCGNVSCDTLMGYTQTLFGYLATGGLVVGQLDGALRHPAPEVK